MQEEKKSLAGIMTKVKIRLIIAAAAAVAVLVVIAVIFAKGYSNATEKYEDIIAELEEENKKLSDQILIYTTVSKEVDISVINTEIQDIGELATLEYLYTDAGKFEDPQELFGKELPFSFTTKSFILKWDGIIKAGVDISKITAKANHTDKIITVSLPAAEILSHEIDENSVETLDEKAGLFNPIKVEDINQFNIASKESMEQRAVENGILEKALENAEEIIYKLINTEVVQRAEYKIEFQRSAE